MLAENNENRNCGCSRPMNNNSNMMINNGDQNPMAISAAIGMDTDCDNCCCERKQTPNIPMYHYHFTKAMPEECPMQEETREEMLQNIRCLGFAVVELAEYLDTHVDDEKALCLHREYATRLRDLKEKYQMVYGPLTINFPCNKWRWIEEPWPWERGNF